MTACPHPARSRLLTSALVLAASLFAAAPAPALWDRHESIEWWADMSDAIGVAVISSGRPAQDWGIEVEIERWRPLRTHEALAPGRWLAVGLDNESAPAGRELLLFAAFNPERGALELAFWIDLDAPGAPLAHRAAYDDGQRWLGDRDAILRVVRERISGAGALPGARGRRGMIELFRTTVEDDMHQEFVRTARPADRARALQALRDGDLGQRARAIHDLVSFPGPETAAALRPFLADLTVVETGERGVPGLPESPVHCLPLRHAAYLALRLLGVAVERPAGVPPRVDQEPSWEQIRIPADDPGIWLDVFPIADGLEGKRAYFEYGSWTRFEGLKSARD